MPNSWAKAVFCSPAPARFLTSPAFALAFTDQGPFRFGRPFPNTANLRRLWSERRWLHRSFRKGRFAQGRVRAGPEGPALTELAPSS